MRQRTTSPRRHRHIRFESLENRELLAVDWRNPVDALDINGDFQITAFDALAVINELNIVGAHSLAPPKPPGAPFLDATGNNAVSAFDALAVINHLNLYGSGNYRLFEAPGQFDAERRITVTAGPLAGGTRIYRMEVVPAFDLTDTLSRSEDTFSVYLINPATGQTVADAGLPGTSLFSLTGSKVAINNGLAEWSNGFLTIDLSSFALETLELRLQLLNVDGDNGSSVIVKPWSNVVDPLGTPRLAGTPRVPAAAPGGALSLPSSLSPPNLLVELENAAYDSATDRFTAEVRLYNNSLATVTSARVRLPGLGPSATAMNASGESNGVPYWSFASLIGSNGLAAGERTGWLQVELTLPSNEAFRWRPEVDSYTSPEHLAAQGVFTGIITEAQEQHNYRMNLAKGDWILPLPMRGPGISSVSDPEYRSFANGFELPGIDDTLLQTFSPRYVYSAEEHRVELTGRALGEFAIAFQRLNDLPELALGSRQSGYLDPRVGPLVFKFEGAQGQRIVLEDLLPAYTGPRGSWRVTNEFDLQPPLVGIFGNHREYELHYTGPHYLVYSPPLQSTEFIPYDFVFRAPEVTNHTLSLTFGHPGFFTGFGHRNVYSFNVPAGDRIAFDILPVPTDYADLSLINPAGLRISTDFTKPILLSDAGNWQLVVRGNQAGNYLFRAYRLANLPLFLDGASYGGIIRTDRAMYIRVPATRGERLALVENIPGPIRYQFFGPAGQPLASDSATGPWLVPESGETLLKIDTLDGSYANFAFNVTLQKSLDAPIAKSGLDVDLTGTLASGTSELGVFTASAGTQVMVDKFAVFGDNSGYSISIQGPTSTLPFVGESSVVTLYDSGTYTVRATNLTGSPTTYGLRIIDLDNVPLLAHGDLIDASLSGGKTLVRRVEGRAGDHLLLATMGAARIPNVKIHVKNDSTSFPIFVGDTQAVGYYFASTKSNFITFEQNTLTDVPVKLQGLFRSDAEPLPLSTPFNGVLTGGASKLYRFAAQDGQLLFLDLLSSTATSPFKASLFNNRQHELSTATPSSWSIHQTDEYYLWLHADQTTPVDFSAKVSLTQAAATPLAFDTVITDSVVAGETKRYSLHLNVGEFILIDGLDNPGVGASIAMWERFAGSFVFQQTTADDWTFRVYRTGEYILVVGGGTKPFSFRVLDPSDAPLLPLDTDLQGAIGGDNRVRQWRFPVDAGQRIYIDSNASVANPFLGKIALYDSLTNILATSSAQVNNDLNASFFFADEGLLVISGGAAPFNYDLRARSSEKTVHSTTLGSTVSGQLRDPGDVVEYTFTGNRYQHIHLEALTNATLRIIDPDGNILPTTEGFSYLLKSSGEYRVRLTAGSAQIGVPYKFQLVDVASVPFLPAIDTLISGSTLEGGWVMYRLGAGIGQRYQFDFQSFSGPTTNNSWKLLSPEGTLHFSGAFIDNDQTLTLPQSGDYLLVIRLPGGAIDYSFQVNRLQQPNIGVPEFDLWLDDSVALQERDTAPFLAHAGNQIFIDVLDPVLSPVTTLLGPASSGISIPITGNQLVIAPVAGEYTLEFYGNGSATPLNYRVHLIDVTNLPLWQQDTPFPVNVTESHQSQVWRFSAAAGDQLVFDVLSLGINATWQIHTPDGRSQPLGTTPQIVTMAQTGTHLLVMNAGVMATPISGMGRIRNVANLPNTPGEGPLAVSLAVGEWRLFSFNFNASERVHFTPISAPPAGLQFAFVGPRGQPLTITLNDVLDPVAFTVTRTGPHVLLLANTSAMPLTFQFELHRATIRDVFGVARSS